jgi:hypothetical protein
MFGGCEMKPTKQTILHDPDNGKFGNCLSATLASLLHIPIDEVPVFSLPYPQWHVELNAWLKQYGLAYVSFGDWKEWSNETGITGLNHEISGKTVRHSEVLHSCVGKDGEVVFDPHPDDYGLEEVTSSGLFIALEPWKANQLTQDLATAQSEIARLREALLEAKQLIMDINGKSYAFITEALSQSSPSTNTKG